MHVGSSDRIQMQNAGADEAGTGVVERGMGWERTGGWRPLSILGLVG